VSERALRVAAGLIALAGAGVAGYLTWVHYSGAVVACVRGGGCERVQHSSYAEIADVPVALLGLISYSAIFLLLGWTSENACLAAATLAFVGVLFSAYLLALQLFVIDAVCIWCLANDVVLAPALALLTGLRLRSLTS
jgi:uncharacterized membrane protein